MYSRVHVTVDNQHPSNLPIYSSMRIKLDLLLRISLSWLSQYYSIRKEYSMNCSFIFVLLIILLILVAQKHHALEVHFYLLPYMKPNMILFKMMCLFCYCVFISEHERSSHRTSHKGMDMNHSLCVCRVFLCK